MVDLLKICSSCKEEKKIAEFRRDRTRKDGRQSYCKFCARSKIKERYYLKYGVKYRERNVARYHESNNRVQAYKQTLQCIVCMESHSSCLDFHHVNEVEKAFSICDGMFRNWDIIRTEINKCVPICSNCHRKYHAKAITLPTNINDLKCNIT